MVRDLPAVRAATAADADAILAIYGPVVAGTAISFEEQVPTAGQLRQRIAARPRLPWLVAGLGPHVVGYACATRHRTRPAYRWAADCSAYVAAGHRGTGVGRLLYERLLAELRALGYVSAHAGIALPNDASVALHESLGFRQVGVHRAVGYKLGAWRDVGTWSLQLVDPLPDPPAEPREWSPAGARLAGPGHG
ncbi:MAG: GNAT family N-acetyltransferase [Frankiaceae bacterium]